MILLIAVLIYYLSILCKHMFYFQARVEQSVPFHHLPSFSSYYDAKVKTSHADSVAIHDSRTRITESSNQAAAHRLDLRLDQPNPLESSSRWDVVTGDRRRPRNGVSNTTCEGLELGKEIGKRTGEEERRTRKKNSGYDGRVL